MSDSVFVMWIGNCHRPTILKVNLKFFNVPINGFVKNKLYIISDTVYYSLIKEVEGVEIYATNSDNFAAYLNVSSSVVTNDTLPLCWKKANFLNEILHDATYTLKAYEDSIEECIYANFSRENKEIIVHLTLKEIKHELAISYLERSESLVIHVNAINMKPNNKEHTSEIIHSISLPNSLKSQLAIFEYLVNVINSRKYNIEINLINNITVQLVIINNYLETLSNIDILDKMKPTLKVAMINYLNSSNEVVLYISVE